tara:strand:- start:956 stop:1312 length:357 start_codon:yes stop_codon:yes gene_type:complete
MTKSANHQAILFFITVLIFGCYNAPTSPSEIEGAHISGLHYEKHDCQALNDEIKFLEKREKELVIAQDKRIKESDDQEFWTEGIGMGDGIVASELNNVRGEKKAARRVFETKGCTIKQ